MIPGHNIVFIIKSPADGESKLTGVRTDQKLFHSTNGWKTYEKKALAIQFSVYLSIFIENQEVALRSSLLGISAREFKKNVIWLSGPACD